MALPLANGAVAACLFAIALWRWCRPLPLRLEQEGKGGSALHVVMGLCLWALTISVCMARAMMEPLPRVPGMWLRGSTHLEWSRSFLPHAPACGG